MVVGGVVEDGAVGRTSKETHYMNSTPRFKKTR